MHNRSNEEVLAGPLTPQVMSDLRERNQIRIEAAILELRRKGLYVLDQPIVRPHYTPRIYSQLTIGV